MSVVAGQYPSLKALAELLDVSPVSLLLVTSQWFKREWTGASDSGLEFLLALARYGNPMPWEDKFGDMDELFRLRALCYISDPDERRAQVLSWYANLSAEKQDAVNRAVRSVLDQMKVMMESPVGVLGLFADSLSEWLRSNPELKAYVDALEE